MSEIYWTFQDIANFTDLSYTYVRDNLMKREGAPKPVIGRSRFLKSECLEYLTGRQARKQTG